MLEMEEKRYETVLKVIRTAFWGKETCTADQAVFEEMKMHVIAALPAPILGDIEMPDDLRDEWEKVIIRTLAYYYKYTETENKLPITVPYTILKGTSAAKYYPHAELRAMGDIDIMTHPDDHQTACEELLAGGYKEVTGVVDLEQARHREFEKNGVKIEVHLSFTKLNNPDNEKNLDELIVNNLTPSHQLPDMINGLVLIEHINQHMESGIGLRQIIDWMMFVDHCLPDENWQSFQTQVKKIGLEKLAAAVTKMCEIYLGLPKREWCDGVDEDLCRQLMDYIFGCGNFGNKEQDNSKIMARSYAFSNNLIGLFRVLQAKGIQNWKLLHKWPFLRGFAWMYQAGSYFQQVFFRRGALKKISSEYLKGKDQTYLFEKLGVLQTAKRNVFFMDKSSIKEKRT